MLLKNINNIELNIKPQLERDIKTYIKEKYPKMSYRESLVNNIINVIFQTIILIHFGEEYEQGNLSVDNSFLDKLPELDYLNYFYINENDFKFLFDKMISEDSLDGYRRDNSGNPLTHGVLDTVSFIGITEYLNRYNTEFFNGEISYNDYITIVKKLKRKILNIFTSCFNYVFDSSNNLIESKIETFINTYRPFKTKKSIDLTKIFDDDSLNEYLFKNAKDKSLIKEIIHKLKNELKNNHKRLFNIFYEKLENYTERENNNVSIEQLRFTIDTIKNKTVKEIPNIINGDSLFDNDFLIENCKAFLDKIIYKINEIIRNIIRPSQNNDILKESDLTIITDNIKQLQNDITFYYHYNTINNHKDRITNYLKNRLGINKVINYDTRNTYIKNKIDIKIDIIYNMIFIFKKKRETDNSNFDIILKNIFDKFSLYNSPKLLKDSNESITYSEVIEIMDSKQYRDIIRDGSFPDIYNFNYFFKTYKDRLNKNKKKKENQNTGYDEDKHYKTDQTQEKSYYDIEEFLPKTDVQSSIEKFIFEDIKAKDNKPITNRILNVFIIILKGIITKEIDDSKIKDLINIYDEFAKFKNRELQEIKIELENKITEASGGLTTNKLKKIRKHDEIIDILMKLDFPDRLLWLTVNTPWDFNASQISEILQYNNSTVISNKLNTSRPNKISLMEKIHDFLVSNGYIDDYKIKSEYELSLRSLYEVVTIFLSENNNLYLPPRYLYNIYVKTNPFSHNMFKEDNIRAAVLDIKLKLMEKISEYTNSNDDSLMGSKPYIDEYFDTYINECMEIFDNEKNKIKMNNNITNKLKKSLDKKLLKLKLDLESKIKRKTVAAGLTIYINDTIELLKTYIQELLSFINEFIKLKKKLNCNQTFKSIFKLDSGNNKIRNINNPEELFDPEIGKNESMLLYLILISEKELTPDKDFKYRLATYYGIELDGDLTSNLMVN